MNIAGCIYVNFVPITYCLFLLIIRLIYFLFISFADAPLIKSVGPDKLTTSPLYSKTEFVCSADGNPPPTYQWLQQVPNPNGGPPDTVIVRSSEPKLVFTNITYDYQGDYVCVVSNMISGTKRTIQSQPITLQVIGK